MRGIRQREEIERNIEHLNQLATVKAWHAELPGRFFTVGFAISPGRGIVPRHYKLAPLLPAEHSVEHPVTPYDGWDRWVELYGDGCGNWLNDLTTEQYQTIYREPIYPKQLYLHRRPYEHAAYRREVTEAQIERMHRRGIWARPDPGSTTGR